MRASSALASPLTERQRLELIVKAFVFCKQELNENEISDQFRREVKNGELPDRDVMRSVIKSWAGRTE